MLNRINHLTLFLTLAVLAIGCTCGSNTSSKGHSKEPVKTVSKTADAVHKTVSRGSLLRNFALPQIPSMITGHAETAQYLSMHFWDNFFCDEIYYTDTVIINGIARDELEQAMANFVSLLYAIPLDNAQDRLQELTAKTIAYSNTEAAKSFMACLEHYVYDPNSPFRNEDFFLPVALLLSEWNALSPVEREKYALYAKYCSYNQIGTVAADFSYCDSRGNISTLHQIKAKTLVIFFSNPGCNTCKEIITTMSTNEAINKAISQGRLKILNLYIDEDLDAWYNYMPIYPSSWINAYQPDFTVKDDTIYNIRAIPSIYILDEEKRVIMRDVPESVAINYLQYV